MSGVDHAVGFQRFEFVEIAAAPVAGDAAFGALFFGKLDRGGFGGGGFPDVALAAGDQQADRRADERADGEIALGETVHGLHTHPVDFCLYECFLILM